MARSPDILLPPAPMLFSSAEMRRCPRFVRARDAKIIRARRLAEISPFFARAEIALFFARLPAPRRDFHDDDAPTAPRVSAVARR